MPGGVPDFDRMVDAHKERVARLIISLASAYKDMKVQREELVQELEDERVVRQEAVLGLEKPNKQEYT